MYENIIVTVDLADPNSWKKALPTAVAFSQSFGSAIRLMTVVPEFGLASVAQYFPDDYTEKATEAAEAELKELAADNLPSDIPVEVSVAHGSPYSEILRIAKETGADLIIMTSHRPELKDYLLGPNAARVVRHADCSVMVLRG